jgi:hypothetical protein
MQMHLCVCVFVPEYVCIRKMKSCAYIMYAANTSSCMCTSKMQEGGGVEGGRGGKRERELENFKCVSPRIYACVGTSSQTAYAWMSA